MKKVQQVLALPGGEAPALPPSILRHYVPDEVKLRALHRTFAKSFPLDESAAGLAARSLATSPDKCQGYVMKPQREGGGNNFYGLDMVAQLEKTPEARWASYILMELITPPPARNAILRNGQVEEGGVISELGVYGTCLWDQETGEILSNEQAGYLLRTKGENSKEGGVAAGFGCMDSCYLV